MDILGPFPKATRQRKFIFVAVDYFTKWVEAWAVASITKREVCKFTWTNIITRFGVPRAMAFDNGCRFDTNEVRDYCAKYDIQKKIHNCH